MYNNSNSIFATAGKIVAFILGLFILGNVVGLLTNINQVNTIQTVNIQTTESTAVNTETSTVVTTTETTTETTTGTTTEATTTTEPTTTAVTTTEDTTPDSKQEIVDIFNKSANNVKKNARVVTRNYENLIYDRGKTDYPAILLAVARPLINSWLVNHDTPIEYTERDIIAANFPVKGKDWSSKLTAKDVEDATITEKDGKYYIVIDLKDCKDPAENTGVCSVMEEVNLAKVRELADIVSACETEYYDCKIECAIEKDTGNMVYVKYTQPMILNLTAGRVRDMDATFAMSIESEFEIAY